MTSRDGVQALTLDVHLGPEDLAAALRSDALTGLTSSPKQLQPRWFYDEAGCFLFDRITSLEEYYLTRREREILVNHADDIAVATGADTLVELGSGTSEKTRILLDAFAGAGALERFAHVAAFDPGNEWIEMRLRSLERQTVPVVDLGLEVEFADGEEMRTEVSTKFRREGVVRELEAAGLELRHFWSDEGGDFGLFLAFR